MPSRRLRPHKRRVIKESAALGGEGYPAVDHGGLIESPQPSSGGSEAGLDAVPYIEGAAKASDGPVRVSCQSSHAPIPWCQQVNHPVCFLESADAHHNGGGLHRERSCRAHRPKSALQVPK